MVQGSIFSLCVAANLSLVQTNSGNIIFVVVVHKVYFKQFIDCNVLGVNCSYRNCDFICLIYFTGISKSDSLFDRKAKLLTTLGLAP
jgi:hypothetical protein